MSAEGVGRSVGAMWARSGLVGKIVFFGAITAVLTMCVFSGQKATEQQKAQHAGNDHIAAPPPPQPLKQAQAPTKTDIELNMGILAGQQIKKALKNPKSFNLESFLIFPGGATCYEYRGTNSFNAVVPGQAVFDPKDGAILTADRDGNRFVKKWNSLCTKSCGKEHAGGLKALSVF